jgi:hypothetical protein
LCEEQKEKYNINILNQTSEVQVWHITDGNIIAQVYVSL